MPTGAVRKGAEVKRDFCNGTVNQTTTKEEENYIRSRLRCQTSLCQRQRKRVEKLSVCIVNLCVYAESSDE